MVNSENTGAELISEQETVQFLPEVVITQLRDTAREWSKIQLIYESALKQVNTKIEILSNEFKLTHEYNPIEHVTSRIKSPESIAKKLRHNDLDVTMENIVKCLNDVAGIRIICSFTTDIYKIADMLAAQEDVNVIKIKDYIANPKENGYKSYHMIISVPVYLSEGAVEAKVEIQIRTIAMDFWASLEHKMYYKFEGNAPANIRRELKECADLAAFLDAKMLALNEEIKEYAVERTDDDDIFSEIMYGEKSAVKSEEAHNETVEKVSGDPEPEILNEENDAYRKEVNADDSDMIDRLKSVFMPKTANKTK